MAHSTTGISLVEIFKKYVDFLLPLHTMPFHGNKLVTKVTPVHSPLLYQRRTGIHTHLVVAEYNMGSDKYEKCPHSRVGFVKGINLLLSKITK